MARKTSNIGRQHRESILIRVTCESGDVQEIQVKLLKGRRGKQTLRVYAADAVEVTRLPLPPKVGLAISPTIVP